MMVSYKVVFLCFLVAETTYVCDCQSGAHPSCVAGDDNTGTGSMQSPYRTWSKVLSTFRGMGAGDSVLLCRGGVWRQNGAISSNRWNNQVCTAAAPCTVADYTPTWGGSAKPKIIASGTSNLVATENGGRTMQQFGYIFRNLHFECTGSCGKGFFIYEEVRHMIIENMYLDGFSIGVSIEERNKAILNKNISIINSTIVNSTAQGIFGAAQGLNIIGNTFIGNGERPLLDHNIYLGGGENVVVRGNYLFRSAIQSNGKCQAVSFVVHGLVKGLLIEDNVIEEEVGLADNACWGIAVDQGYSDAESFEDVVIRCNTLKNLGNVFIGTTHCANCKIQNNLLIQQQPISTRAILVPDKTPSPEDGPTTNIDVENNFIYINTASGGTGVTLGQLGTGHKLFNNSVYYTGTGSFTCFSTTLPASSYENIDYNKCYTPNTNSAVWNTGYNTLAAWRAATPWDDNGSTSPLTVPTRPPGCSGGTVTTTSSSTSTSSRSTTSSTSSSTSTSSRSTTSSTSSSTSTSSRSTTSSTSTSTSTSSRSTSSSTSGSTSTSSSTSSTSSTSTSSTTGIIPTDPIDASGTTGDVMVDGASTALFTWSLIVVGVLIAQ